MTGFDEAIITNARIKSTMLGVEDHGIMTFMLMLEWSGAGCGFGGYGLDGRDPETKLRRGHGHAYQAIRIILETLGVASWEKLPGTLVRIEDSGPGGRLRRIGHIMDDRWFDIEAYMKEGESGA